ncbi:MAG TPA: UbiD family decarboxylase [Candidatus Binatia bacterium]|nr:UbiD family decarboxylase [Candidatus Binatia bacterium]
MSNEKSATVTKLTMIPPRQYPDLHEHLDRLERDGLLIRVKEPVDKDQEMHPLVRWQFRGGIKEKDRKAFLFENPVDAKGKTYDIPVAIGILAANRTIYGIGLGCDPTKVNELWAEAKTNPIAPVEIPSEAAPVHEVVYQEEDLKVPGQGVDGIPVPISTPGWDNAPYISAAHFITKDPDSGIHNIGTYRAMIKAPDRVGCNPSLELGQGIYVHWEKYRARQERMPAALCIGGVPAISYVAAQKLNYDVDEFAVAGGLVKAPIRVVKAKTVPLMVPADAEIIIEGWVNTEWLEPEAPFGESHGHVNPKEYNPYMEVTAITRRKKAVLCSIISQVTPSESSVIKKMAYEPLYLDHLRNALGVKCVIRVMLHEPLTATQKLTVIQMRKPSRAEVWRAMMGAVAFRPSMSKIVVAVDEDIDPENMDAVFWALGYRSQPHRDVQIIRGTDIGHAPRHDARGSADDSCLLWDATLKETFPPISLPKKEYMERARKLWEKLNLPKLEPESPWHGYSLGDWNTELDEEAKLAIAGEFWQTGEKIALERRRTADVPLNTSYYGHQKEK